MTMSGLESLRKSLKLSSFKKSEKIKKYFAMLLNWDKHKYDEVRKEKPVIEEKKKQKK